MAYFTSSPSIGDTVELGGGNTFIWNGTAWDRVLNAGQAGLSWATITHIQSLVTELPADAVGEPMSLTEITYL